jgi:hypothetical protein
METNNFQTLAEIAEQRNIHRLHSLHDLRVPLGSASLTEIVAYREHVLSVYDNTVQDLFVLDDELARRTPIELCGD